MPASSDYGSQSEKLASTNDSIDNGPERSLRSDFDYVEEIRPTPTRATNFPTNAEGLSPEHHEYLLKRHGTLELDPLPNIGDADPYNWPKWKKTTNLVLVAIHASMSTFTAACIIPAYQVMAADLGVSLQQVSYLTSLQIAILGVAPLVWKPFSSRFGRRPIFLLSLICSLVGNIGCAVSPNYNSMAVCRAIVAFFVSPAAAIGSAVVTETYFKKERARYMGIWTLMITLGVPVGPFIFGFVSYHVGYRWIYWILAIINGVQFMLYIFLGPETRYLRTGVSRQGSDLKQEYFTFSRIDPKPLNFREFIQPLGFFRYASIMIPAVSYAMAFCIGGVLITVELPQLFGMKFMFNPQQLGLQFLGIIIGNVIGEQLGGVLSDTWMNRRTRKLNGIRPAPEYRLWLSYSGFALLIIGTVVFLMQTQAAPPGEWNISPVIGIGIASAGVQIVTTVLITYAIDCYQEESASIGVFITFVRQVWGFIGPFWFPAMFANVGVAASAGVCTALIVAFSVVPIVLVQWRGQVWRDGKATRAEEKRSGFA